jgi:DnaJ-class molecular chaperone
MRTTDVTISQYKAQIEVLRLHGMGLPLFGVRGCGDLNLRIEIKIPERLTAG